MIVVIFQVVPKPGREDDYFEAAKALADEVARIDGFISVERFASVTNPGKFLSLSLWRDEAAVERWYAHAGHRKAQARGRGDVFADYRITVAAVIRDYDMAAGRPEAS
ncbi:MAG: antibiotic biosynthesis monooxygenase [Alphaproteobacteria bacterium]|nr:antibiotic biosynthesis monooxygenase [Alphaproteobacteria bacterium]